MAPKPEGHGVTDRQEESVFWSRCLSLAIFFLGCCTFLGVDSYRDFYLDLKTRIQGQRIDYAVISDFCGWTRGKYPGESDLAYGLRASWNMGSAMLAMVSLSSLVFAAVFGGIFWVFKAFGAFNPERSCRAVQRAPRPRP